MPLQTVEVELRELERHPDALLDIYTRKLDMIVVHDVYPTEPLARIVSRLEGYGPEFDWTPQEDRDRSVIQMMLLGEAITPNVGLPRGPEKDHYFGTAGRFRESCRELFAETHDFETRLEEVLGRMSGGRPLAIPRSDDGRPYTPATIRSLPPGTVIPMHVGNFFLETGGYEHLSTFVSLVDQLSYFVVLAEPETGGALEVFDLEWRDPRTPMANDGRWDEEAIVRSFASERFSPPTGSLLVFDGGRFYHRVARVEGDRTRWTIGGFLGFHRDMSRVYYWN